MLLNGRNLVIRYQKSTKTPVVFTSMQKRHQIPLNAPETRPLAAQWYYKGQYRRSKVSTSKVKGKRQPNKHHRCLNQNDDQSYILLATTINKRYSKHPK
jgi:hypothetical protein